MGRRPGQGRNGWVLRREETPPEVCPENTRYNNAREDPFKACREASGFDTDGHDLEGTRISLLGAHVVVTPVGERGLDAAKANRHVVPRDVNNPVANAP